MDRDGTTSRIVWVIITIIAIILIGWLVFEWLGNDGNNELEDVNPTNNSSIQQRSNLDTDATTILTSTKQ